MTESWFHRLEDDLRHVTSHFHHSGNTIDSEHMQPATPQEHPMALADTAAALQTSHASALAELQDMLVKAHDVVDNHMPQLRAAIDDVAAVASIADHPGVVAMVEALGVPAPILEPFIAGLVALGRAFPKTDQPQPDQQAA